jgi:hypothetical protein
MSTYRPRIYPDNPITFRMQATSKTGASPSSMSEGHVGYAPPRRCCSYGLNRRNGSKCSTPPTLLENVFPQTLFRSSAHISFGGLWPDQYLRKGLRDSADMSPCSVRQQRIRQPPRRFARNCQTPMQNFGQLTVAPKGQEGLRFILLIANDALFFCAAHCF